MTTQKDILDAINDKTAQCFPGRTTYRDAWPEQFERPSLFLVAEQREDIGGNRFTVERRQVFGIQINDRVDEHYEADTDRLGEETDRLMQMLSLGVLPVGDRALHIDKLESERIETACIVKVTLHWFDDRLTEQTQAPPVQTLDIVTEVRNGGTQ
nr:hypothetical protein [uncultured Butyricicoccus sp.]